MGCKSIVTEIEEIKSYEILQEEQKSYGLTYCISYRHPNLPEWILARGYWNNEGVWFPDGVWEDN